MAGADPEQPIFYYDLASPEAYLAAERSAERARHGAGVAAGAASGLRAGELGPFRCPAEVDAYREDIERRAVLAGHAAAALARAVPARRRVGDARRHLREADRPRRGVLARRVPPGVRRRARPRRADNVLIAAAACEMHPTAVEQGRRAATRPPRALDEATDAAGAAGVLEVPAIRIGDRVFHGDRELELAAAALA